MIEDRPGRLSRLLGIVSGTGVNVLEIGHLRHPSVPMGHVEVQLTLETRDYAHAEEVRERLRESGYRSERAGDRPPQARAVRSNGARRGAAYAGDQGATTPTRRRCVSACASPGTLVSLSEE